MMINNHSFLKDGCIDFTNSEVKNVFRSNSLLTILENLSLESIKNGNRIRYYQKKIQDPTFRKVFTICKQEVLTSQTFHPRFTGKEKVLRQSVLSENNERKFNREEIITKLEQISSNVQLTATSVASLSIISTGSFGRIYRGVGQRSETFILKTIIYSENDNDEKSYLYILKEASLLSYLQRLYSTTNFHPNIIGFYGCTLFQDHISIVLEDIPDSGDLHFLLYESNNPFIESYLSLGKVKKQIFLGIVSAVIFLHQHNIIHGDLKPKNILLTKDFIPKLIDFGSSRSFPYASQNLINDIELQNFELHRLPMSLFCSGTAGYVAPEIIVAMEEVDKDISKLHIYEDSLPNIATDLYSLGIILNELLHEELPYYDQLPYFLNNPEFAVQEIVRGHLPCIDVEIVKPEQLRQLLQEMLALEPENRPSLTEVQETLDILQFSDLISVDE